MRCGPVALALLVLGCASRPTSPPVAPKQPDPCAIVAASPNQLDTFTVVLLEPVEWASLDHALSPANDSERLLFRNLFRNVIQLDCQDTVRPGLADTWTVDPGAGWIFALREQTADLVAVIVDSAIVLDPQHVRVPLRGRDSIPRFLADPALALVTGMASDGNGPGGGFELRAANGTLVYFKLEPNGDARDVLDRGADLIVSRDPSIVDYVTNRAELATFPLPWSRTYVLAERETAQPLAAAVRDSSVRRSLASDAVRAEARAADSLEWWSDTGACGRRSPSGAAVASRRIVYPQGDSTARRLAERIVALVPATSGLRSAGLDAAEFGKAVREGTERAYVLAVPLRSLVPCRDAALWPAGAALTPLIETRAFAIVRRGAPRLSVDWDGTLRILDP